MGKRNIGRLTHFQRQANANNFRIHVIKAGGFQIETEALGVLQPIQPALEVCLFEDDLILTNRGLHRSARPLGLATTFFSAYGRRLAAFNVIHAFVFAFQQLAQPLAEFHLFIQGDQRFAIRMSNIQIIQAHRQLAVDFNGGQLIGEKRLIAMLFKLLGQSFGAPESERFHSL